MSKQTQLRLASLAMMMLPYKAVFLFALVVLAAVGSAAYSTIKNIWRDSNVQVRLAAV